MLRKSQDRGGSLDGSPFTCVQTKCPYEKRRPAGVEFQLLSLCSEVVQSGPVSAVSEGLPHFFPGGPPREKLSLVSNCLELHAKRRVLTVEREEHLEISERDNWRSYVQKSVQNQYRHHVPKTQKEKMSLEMSYLSLEILLPIGYTREWTLTWENARAIVPVPPDFSHDPTKHVSPKGRT